MLKKGRILVNLKTLFIILAFLAVNCETTNDKAPWEPKVYVGDHLKGDITRDKGKDRIKPTDPKFSNFICLEGMDFKKLYTECLERSYAE